MQAVTQGTDAQAIVAVRLKQNNRIFSASGADTDVLVASAVAYINCLDKLKNKLFRSLNIMPDTLPFVNVSIFHSG